jgi:hypothetical protein
LLGVAVGVGLAVGIGVGVGGVADAVPQKPALRKSATKQARANRLT